MTYTLHAAWNFRKPRGRRLHQKPATVVHNEHGMPFFMLDEDSNTFRPHKYESLESVLRDLMRLANNTYSEYSIKREGLQ